MSDTPAKDVQVMQPYEAGFSTNLYLVHPKYGKQQFTFRGAFCTDWRYVMKDLALFIDYMGKSDWRPDVPQVAPLQHETPSPPDAVSNQSACTWRTKSGSLDMDKGKLHLIVPPGGTEPQDIACPLHAGKTLKRRTKKDGTGNAWMSHKEGDDWCTAWYEHQSPEYEQGDMLPPEDDVPF